MDGLGSTTALTDETGTVVSTSRYDAFGETTGGTDTVANKYLFAGEQYDSNLGDYYLRARYYDTDTGRFTRRDTYEGRLGEPLTLNKYIYADTNPVNNVDPTGLFALKEVLVVIRLIGILAAATYAGTLGGDTRQGVLTSLNAKQLKTMTESYPTFIPFLEEDDCEDCDGCYFADVQRKGFKGRTDEFEELGDGYATYITDSPNDFFVLTPQGVGTTFDGRTPGTRNVWETKWGNDFVSRIKKPSSQESMVRGLARRWDIEERQPQLIAATECRYNLTWAISNEDVARIVKNLWGNIPPVEHRPWNPYG